MKVDIRQIVLSNGQELLCEVIQWPDPESEEEVMIIRKAAKIIIQENFEQGTRWFTFRPFMTYQDDNSSLCSLMPYHIITIGRPSKILRSQYTKYQKLLSQENNGTAEDPFQYFQEGGDSDNSFTNVIPFTIDPNKLN